jgi:hypothetical protein
LISLSTLRSGGHPPPRKTRFRLLARLYRTGLVTRRVPSERFRAVAFLLSRASWRKVRPGFGFLSGVKVAEEWATYDAFARRIGVKVDPNGSGNANQTWTAAWQRVPI